MGCCRWNIVRADTNDNDVYVSGERGLILHKGMYGFGPLRTNTSVKLRGIFGVAGIGAFVSGDLSSRLELVFPGGF